MSKVLGIHHVTAIAGDPQRNVDFYAGVLGLRLVKRTVNFDDPTTYHLYFGDERGSPGSIMTFFPWPGAPRGRAGTGQVAVTSFSIHPRSVGFWIERLVRHQVMHDGPIARGGGDDAERVISLRDRDGLLLELVAHAAAADRPAWERAPGIPGEHAIHGFHGITIWADNGDATERVLTDALGFRAVREDQRTRRFAVGDGGPGRIVDVRSVGGFGAGAIGAGTVHHVAFAVHDDESQAALREQLLVDAFEPTPVIDRKYFRSVYFHEPGGVLFELATIPPGFTVDEPLDRLGAGLMLPEEYEADRAELERTLPPIHVPDADANQGVAVASPLVAASTGALPAPGAPPPHFRHRWIPAADPLSSRTTLLLLHGTGGDEDDLIPLGRALLPDAGMLSPRGKVLEHGAARWFRRLGEGVFDLDDLAWRTDDLAEFIRADAAVHEFDLSGVIAVGFSNGANMAVSLLLRRPELLQGAILLSPMLPYDPEPLPELRGRAVFIGAGRNDPVAPAWQVERLALLLERAGAQVTIHWTDGGHDIAGSEVTAAREWLTRLQRGTPVPSAAAAAGSAPRQATA